ncbi:hypothetical protein SSIM_12120 [Staphylococcus simulans UMC-CNS-990]|uniref:Uncharacterized protein n=1 Tax=Staphylococcus simulans UMC-CNS-990 TaxID=1405498 RepID=A0ABN0PA99_STASI|nr:hypothetical protein SSIM_12120 [Staphylococcus simulans UMC-CNS-990]
MLIYLKSAFLNLDSVFLGLSIFISVFFSSLIVKKMNANTSLKVILVSVFTLVLFTIIYGILKFSFSN